MTREEKNELLNVLLEIEEKNDIGNLTRSDRAEFQIWVKEALDIINKYQMIEQILDDYNLEAWEILEKIKLVVKV